MLSVLLFVSVKGFLYMSQFVNEIHKDKREFKVGKKMMLKFLMKYAAFEKWYLLLGIILTFLRVGLFVACPIILAEIFNLIQKRVYSSEYIKLGVLYILIYFLGSALQFARSVVMDYTVGNISYRIRADVYEHLQAVPLSYYDSMPAGSIVSRIMSDTKLVEHFFHDFLVNVFTPIVNIILAYFTLLVLDINLALIAFLSLPLMIGLVIYLMAKIKEPLKLQRRQLAEITSSINESVQGIDVISTLNREDFRIKQLDKKTDDYNTTKRKIERVQARLQWPLYTSIQYLIICIGIAYFGYGTLVWGLSLPLGSIYIFIRYSENIQEQFMEMSFNIERMFRSFAAVDHICELLQLPRYEVKILGGLSAIKGSVEYKNVDFSYVKEERVLRNMSFKLEAGKTIALVGRTGSGKSTIANLLFNFYPIDAGDILIDGKSLYDYPLYKLREEMGIVLQEPFLFEGTLYDNISLGNPKISKEVALEALQMIGAKSILKRFNNDIMAKVTTQGKEFSQGERQLISFARALAHNPKILILDEATSSIDTETEQQIRRAVEVLAKNRSMIIIAHRLSTIQHADCIYVLDHGEVKEKGKHRELIDLGGIYYDMAKQQEIC